MSDDDEIHPWNGHRGTPQDKLALGCAWLVGIAFGFIVLMAVVGVATDLWDRHAAEHRQPEGKS